MRAKPPESRDRIERTLGNPAWRVKHLYSVVDKKSKRIPFRPNAVQARINAVHARRKLILKARQFGVSTNELIKQFDWTIWGRNRTAGIIAHEQDGIEKLFRIVRFAYEALDPMLRPRLDRGGGSKYELYFPDINSRIYCDLEIRGGTIGWLHVSEAAFIKDVKRMLASLEAVPLDGFVTLETTPNGMNEFYDRWNDVGDSYERLFYPWFLFPDYSIETAPLKRSSDEKALAKHAKERFGVTLTDGQIAFRRFKQKDLKGLFVQEYPEDDQSCFLSSGAAAMDLVAVKKQLEAAPEPIRVSEDGLVRYYQEYDKTQRYVIGADTSEGVGGDRSGAIVMNARTREEVATLHGQMKPYEFANRLDELAREYHTGGRPFPLLAVERNNHGHAVLLQLNHTLNYPNLYHRQVGDEEDPEPGWVTDRVTRPIMLDAYIDGVEHQSVVLRDREGLRECLTLVVEDGKIQAAAGKHDDLVMAGAITVQMCLLSRGLDVYDNIAEKILV